MERLERGGLIVRRAILPTAIENADPCEGQGAHGRLVCLALVALLLGIDLGPEGMPDRFRSPCHACVSEERRTLPAPMDPGLLATAFRDRRDTRVFLACRGRGVAFPLCAKGHEEARGKDRTGAWQGVKQGAVGMVLGALRDGVVEVGNGRHGDTELGDEGLHQEHIGGDDAVIGGQRARTLDGLEAGGDHGGRAHVVGPEEALKGGATRELGGFEGWPAAQEVTKDRRIFLLKPLQDVREGVCEGTGQAVGATHVVADQAPAVFHEWRQGAHGGALGGEWGECVAVFEEHLDLEFGIGGVICGSARGKRCAVSGHGERMDGKEPEELLWAQRRHDGPFMEFQAYGKRVTVEPRAQTLDPRVDRVRSVIEAQKLPVRRAGGLSTAIVFGIRPVEADTRRTFLCRDTLHVSPPSV